MVLVSAKVLVDKAYQNHFAVGAFNVGNSEFVKNILAVAEDLKSPVIMQIHPYEYDLMGSDIVKYVREAAMTANVPVAIHLDHGRDINDVMRALRDQMNSVMIDTSGLPFAENLATTKQVVDLAHRIGVAVEAELGSIGNRNATADNNMGRVYTDPKSAKEFVDQTGVDDLAVAIGTVHGPYPSGDNDIKIDRLDALNEVLHMPLVLHGGSNNPNNKIKEAIAHGIAKVNISTDIKMPYYHAIKDTVLAKPDQYEPWIMTPAADEVQKQVLRDKMLLFGSDDKAKLYFNDPETLKPLYPYDSDIVDEIIYDQQTDETLVAR
ncbi:ketose-bisphosphate aldolase [Loigolactobacillus coryniformis]|uniref:Fructose-bisphosphate aldolase n=1 Tax=Loigolactobacillus coryniformis subsp. coryniformis KCTC 3167 = DSM 20001 TaxID=913848 RepID=A0A0R1F5I7_9LACO|nr:ketose-bisphosphate aldolase [Loigolactobacillus coryniformis]KRK14450.1 Fructose-bisphosphate aldolase [Loigolactobacillus coryniformis subsp. coryniformis KCTC 3167 = DSM 20001]